MKKLALHLILAIGISCTTKPLAAAELATFAATTATHMHTLSMIAQIQAAVEAKLLMAPEEHWDTLRPTLTAEVWQEMSGMADAPWRRPFVDNRSAAPTFFSCGATGDRDKGIPSKQSGRKPRRKATDGRIQQQPRNKR